MKSIGEWPFQIESVAVEGVGDIFLAIGAQDVEGAAS